MVNTKAMSGFMELTPDMQVEFDRIKRIIEESYCSFGFTPLDTPVLERSEVLLAKAGGETEKQIYRFTRGDSDISLRFDLTVPLARYVADHYNDLTFPFRRSHIAKVYRGERPQKGRYREFYQCDIDVIGEGELSIAYDAEIPRVIYSIFSQLDFGKFTIRVSNRKILSGLIDYLGMGDISTEIMRVIDKADKVSRAELNAELKSFDMSSRQLGLLNRYVFANGSSDDILTTLRSAGIGNAELTQGIDELETVVSLMRSMGIPESYFRIDLTIARGLDYYTGTIYETTLDEYPRLGSVCSGGRYDDLASHYIGKKLPGVGVSIGLTRLFSQLIEQGIVKSRKKSIADVLVMPLDSNQITDALQLADNMRNSGMNVDVLLTEGSVKKKFRYADRIGIQQVVVVGADEVRKGRFILQDMVSGERQKLTLEELTKLTNE
ncbi:MAG: histidine--tRNA ligase [Candidatus Saccharibacteria bacterium]|nr:histidine--tRNA ligase [Candidatus Saccharibacteria bacterium]